MIITEKTNGKYSFYHKLGSVFYAMGEYERAIANLSRCIELNEQKVSAYLLRAKCYDAISLKEEALNDALQAKRCLDSIPK